MALNDYRKKIFINSQCCTYYNINKYTILAGIMRSKGYLYSVNLPDEKIKQVNATYRKFTALLNSLVALELILYIYLVIFPNFITFMKMPFWASILILAFIPLVALYLTYLGVNALYENFLSRYIGTFKRTQFKPEIKYIDEKAFNEYENTPRKSVFIILILAVLFFGYIFTPFIISGLNNSKQYNLASNLAGVYLKFVPIAPEVYVDKAYAEFNLKKYNDAVKDYENANKYSLSDSFDDDILGVKTYYLPYKDMLVEFDKAIENEKESSVKYFLRSEKAAYQIKNKDYMPAYKELNTLIKAYEKNEKVFFSPADVYYNRGIVRTVLGDFKGAKFDKEMAHRMCPDCQFDKEISKLIRKP